MKIRIYSRQGCHLCEHAIDLVESFRDDSEVVDVDSDQELIAQYGHRVPVIEIDGQSVLEGRIDESNVRRVLAEH